MSIAVRELKAKLSSVLARAQQGEVIEVTSHNKPIAQIVGIPAQAGPGLRTLVASGAVCWGAVSPSTSCPCSSRPVASR